MWSKVLRRAVLVLASVMTMALMLVGVAHLPFVRARVLVWASARASRQLGFAVNADALRYNLFATSLELQNPSLSVRGERPFLQADAVRVVLDRRALIGTFEIARLEIARPRIAIVRHRDGSTNLPTTTTTSSSQRTPIHLGIVAISQLSLDGEDEAGGQKAAVGPINLTLDTRAPGAAPGAFGPSPFTVRVGGMVEPGVERSIAGTFGGRLGFDGERLTMNELRIDTAEGRLTLNGWINAIAETVRVEAQGQLETDLARAGRLFGAPVNSLSGAAAADVTVAGPIADPTVHVVASARNLQYLSGRPKGRPLPLFPPPSIPEASVQAEATYASGRLEIQRFDVASELGTAAASGTLHVTSAAGPGSDRLHGHVADVDVDRVLDVAGVQLPLKLGSAVTGDVDVTLDGPNPFTENWWRQLSATGALQLAPTGSGLSVEGRLDLGVQHDARWTVAHQLRSSAGRTTVNGVVSGQASQRAGGEFESTLSGRSRVRIDALHALTPFVRQAGFELPAQIAEIDGSVDAVMDPRGTLASPRLLATIAGRGIRVPDFPEGQLDSTVAINRSALTVESLQARLGTTAVSASGSYSWAGQIDSRFDATADDLNAIARLFDVNDLPVTGSGRLVGTMRGTVQSPNGQAELTTQDLSAYEVAVGSVNAQIRMANERVEVDAVAPDLSARLQGSLAIREPFRFQAEATLDRSSISSLLPASMRDQLATEGTISSTVRSQGTLRQPWDSSGEVALRALDVTVSGIPVALQAPATVSIEPSALTAAGIDLRVGEETDVRLQGTLGLNDVRDGLNVHVEGSLSDLLKAAAPALPDTPIASGQSKVTLDLHVGGTLQAPKPTGTLTLAAAALRYADQPPLTDIALDARIEPEQIAVQSLVATWLGAKLQGAGAVPLRLIVPDTSSRTATSGIAAWGSSWLASLPTEPRSATITARLTGISTDVLVPFVDPSTLQAISGTVDATMTAEADAFTLARIRGSLVLDEASLVVADVPFAQTVPTRIRLEQGRAQIEEFRWNAESNELRVSGGADLIAPDRPVDLAVNGDVDLRVLGAFVSGVAAGGLARSALTIKGPIAAPEIVGNIGIIAGELRIDTPSFAASDIEGTIVIPADRDATIALNGVVNGGAATVQGNVSLKNLTAPIGRVTLTARNVTLDYPEGFQTESNADLVLTLAASNSSSSNATSLNATLSGRVDLLSGLYREPLVVSRTLLEGFGGQTGATTDGESSFLKNLALDITVATTEQVRVDNNYGRVNLTANLQITGTALQPGAIGRIEAEPDGEIYLAGNTYRVESLVVDLTSVRSIAPDVSFLADTRIGNVPIEVALQCSAAGVCERDVRSQTAGVTNEEAEALLFGISGNTAEAGAQLARLVSGELLGIVGQTFRLDTLRLEQATGHSDLFDDPTLVAGDVNPASRLTIGKRLGEHVQLAYSQNLAQNGFTMSTSYFAPAGISLRALLLDDQSRSYEFRHEPRFGAPQRRRPAAVSGAVISGIRLTGNLGFPETELRRQLRISEGDHFAFVEWQADRERLIAFYQSHGFFEARVRARRLLPDGAPIQSVSGDTAIQAILLEYAVDRGRPTRLEISGFDVPEPIRQRIVKRWASAIFDGFLERDATLIVREYLFAENRLRATVDARIQRSEADESKTLRVAIDPGPPTTRRLVFEGNAAIPTAALLAAAERAGPLAAWLDPAAFALVLGRLYHEDGLLSAEVNVQAPQIQQEVSVVRVVIREGEPWLIGRVTVDGAADLGGVGSIDRLGLPVDVRYRASVVGERVASLEQSFRDAGFLSAHVTAETALDPSAHQANVRVIAEPGPRTVLASVAVDGSSAMRAAVARNMNLEAGMPVSASELSATRRRLYETGAYRSVDIDLEPVVGDALPPSREALRRTAQALAEAGQGVPTSQVIAGDRKVVARFRLEERPRYTLRYGLAVNDDVVGPDQRSQKIGFAADLENRNVLGLGATLGLSARLRRDQEVGRLYVGVPRFFGLPVRSNVFLSRGRQDIGSAESKTVSDVTEISAEQTYRLRKLVEVRYGYGLGRNRTTFEASDFDLTVRVARLTTSALVDRRNDPFDPSHGWFTSANIELSRPGIGSELSFLRSFIQQFQFVPLRHGIVIASAARLGLARTYGGETLIPSERFFGGGATSVRGYHDEALGARGILGDAEGGSALLIANGEMRFPIYRWLRGVGFVDVGNVYPTIHDLLHTSPQLGAGAGFRLNTPVGLLRLDLGAPVNPRPLDPTWTVHFGLGHAF